MQAIEQNTAEQCRPRRLSKLGVAVDFGAHAVHAQVGEGLLSASALPETGCCAAEVPTISASRVTVTHVLRFDMLPRHLTAERVSILQPLRGTGQWLALAAGPLILSLITS